MKKVLLTAAALLALSPFAAHAMDEHADHGDDAAMEEHHEGDAHAEEHTLTDGTHIIVDGDHVYTVDEHGEHHPAPDGEHHTSDGETIMTKDGMIVQ